MRCRASKQKRERERVDAYGSVSPRELRHINNLFLIDISDRRQSRERLGRMARRGMELAFMCPLAGQWSTELNCRRGFPTSALIVHGRRTGLIAAHSRP